MRLAEHRTALRVWVQAMPAVVGVNTPDVLRPGIVGMRGSYGRTTTAIHDMGTPPPALPPLSVAGFY